MKITVRYFAVFRERLGIDDEQLELRDDATVAEAIAALVDKHDAVAGLANRFQVAVNQTMVTSDHLLASGDELALIPPVAGGANSQPLAGVTPKPLHLDAAINEVAGPTRGAIATFSGVVRNHNQGALC